MESMISINKTTVLNPKNDALRQEGLNTRSDPESIVQLLKNLTQFIHVAWLFKEVLESKLVLKSLCESLSSYPANSDGSWYDFGGCLNIDMRWLDVIKYNITDVDKTELCLRTFAQHKNSTLLSVINALASFKRYDALTVAKKPIEELVKFIHSTERCNHLDPSDPSVANIAVDYQHDSGCFSLPDSNTVDKIIRPPHWEIVYKNLPISILSNENVRNLLSTVQLSTVTQSPTDARKVHVVHQQATPRNRVSNNQQRFRNKTIFLTFASDGEAAAQRIASKLRVETEKRKKYGVLILEENVQVVMRDPEYTIQSLFKKVNYVMPILTEGYLKAIKKAEMDPEATNALLSLDERYARYIYTLICTEYTDNACLNDKFHCLVPEEVKYSSISNELRGQLVFRSWAYEKDMESFVRKIL